jgi:RecA/RadA recombinase
MAKAKVESEKIDLDKILNTARSQFKNKDKGLALQMTRGNEIYIPSLPEDFVYWPDSPWHLMTGVPGFPFGKVVQIAGRPDSGKSTHALQAMALAQKQDHIVIQWDTEDKFAVNRFNKHFGGCAEELLMVRSKVILEGADMVLAYAKAVLDSYPDKKVFVVWDSVGGTMAKGEHLKSLRESNQMAEAAKDNGKAIRGLVSLSEDYRDTNNGKHRVGILLINQTYSNIGSVGQKQSGGQKIEYHSSLIAQLTRKADLTKIVDKIKRKVGISTRAKVCKNHLFDGDHSIAEMVLDITASGITINSKDPTINLLPENLRNVDPELEEVEDFGDNQENEE